MGIERYEQGFWSFNSLNCLCKLRYAANPFIGYYQVFLFIYHIPSFDWINFLIMKRKSFLLLSVLLAVGFLQAQVITIKENIPIFGGLKVGNNVLFALPTGQLGISDGTTPGTVYIASEKVLIDFNNFGSAIMNNKFYFGGINAEKGNELWVTDGTDAGTKMVKDINPGAGSANVEGPNDRGNFAVMDNNLYFVANDGTNGTQLWKSDGTEGGTGLVKVIRSGANPEIEFPSTADSNYYVANNHFLFFTANDGVHGRELWRTNGTAEGTILVKDINLGSASTTFGPTFLSLCGVIVFAANDGQHGMEMWRSNGYGDATLILKDIAPGSFSSMPNQDDRDRLNVFTFQKRIYFTAFEGGYETYSNEQLWVTDGSVPGTMAVTSLNQMQGGFHALLAEQSQAVIIGNSFYFFVNNYNNLPTSLWLSNGTPQGTLMVKPINSVLPEWGPDYRNPIVETLLPKHASTNSDEVSQTLFKGSQFFFVADDGVHYTQLWVSDGSFDGTKMLVVNPNGNGLDFSDESGDFSYEITSEHIYFPGMNTASGKELWRSDGTQAGTMMVIDNRAGSASSNPAILGVANGKILFTGVTNSGSNLYRLDQQVTNFASGGPVYVCPGVSFTLSSDISGNSYQWQVNTPSGYINLEENSNFSGTLGPVLTLSNLPSTAYGWEFRCVVNGNHYSRSYKLRFLAYWVGAVSHAWENPANWLCGGIPDANTDVLIQCMYNSPIISSNASCRSLMLMNRQQVQVAPGFTLTVAKENGQ